MHGVLELTSFSKNQDDIIKERVEWLIIKINCFYHTLETRHFLKNVTKLDLYNYVRLKFIMGEPL